MGLCLQSFLLQAFEQASFIGVWVFLVCKSIVPFVGRALQEVLLALNVHEASPSRVDVGTQLSLTDSKIPAIVC